MVVTNDAEFLWNNVGSAKFKNTSMQSVSTTTSKTATAAPVGEQNPSSTGQRLDSITDEEIIQKNLKELMDKKHQVSFENPQLCKLQSRTSKTKTYRYQQCCPNLPGGRKNSQNEFSLLIFLLLFNLLKFARKSFGEKMHRQFGN